MARHNTHRAQGSALSTMTIRPVGKTAFGMALAGAAVFGTMSGANAAPSESDTTNTTATIPVAAVNAATTEAAQTTQQFDLVSLVAALNEVTAAEGGPVATLQEKLNAKGASLEVDGRYGANTRTAVEDFQASNNLTIDGIVGADTRGALESETSSALVAGAARAAQAPQATATNASTSTSSSSNGSANATNASNASSTPAASSSGQSILSAARSQLGTNYVWGASNPGSGFDCSGFTRWVYKQAGMSLAHGSGAQASGGTRISQSEAQPGDLVYWPGHIGIYAGNGKVIDAGQAAGQVSERSIWGNPTFITYR
ncbi:MAG: NlpC/P60 family protein [Dermabacter sp.]|nr:NlpC/P60 family protein [Dermabacter sp.]